MEDGAFTPSNGKGVAGGMKKLWVQKRKKRQKRCYRKGRKKDRRQGHERESVKAGETDELWENEHDDPHHRHNFGKR